MRQIVLLTLVGMLLFGIVVFGQTKVAAPVLPEGYEQWPNVFHRHLDLGNQKQFNFTVWVKQYGGKETETLFVDEMDGVIVSVWHFFVKEGKPSSSSHVLVKDGYLRISDQDEPTLAVSTDELAHQNKAAMKERFGLDDAALKKIEDFLLVSFDEGLDEFFEKVAKGQKP